MLVCLTAQAFLWRPGVTLGAATVQAAAQVHLPSAARPDHVGAHTTPMRTGHVCGPTTPSTGMPAACWIPATAPLVLGPKIPSTFTSQPRAQHNPCTVRTSSPVAPASSVGNARIASSCHTGTPDGRRGQSGSSTVLRSYPAANTSCTATTRPDANASATAGNAESDR